MIVMIIFMISYYINGIDDIDLIKFSLSLS